MHQGIHKISTCVVFGILGFWLVGCAGNQNRSIISSFEAVTSGKVREGGTFEQVQAASVNGLLPFNALGEEYFFAGKRSVLSGIGVSSVVNSNGSNHTLTYQLIREFPTTASMADLQAIRQEITSSMAVVIQVLRAKRDVEVNQTNRTSDEYKAAMGRYTNLVAAADAKVSNIVNRITNANVLLFRWDTESSKSFGAKLGDVFGLNGSKQKSQQGFGLIAGIRTAHLYVGKDMIHDLLVSKAERNDVVNNRIAIPSFTVGASNLLYFAEEDLSKEIAAKLQGSIQTFSNGASLVKAIDKIELAYVSQQMQKLGNIGVVTGPAKVTARLVPMSFQADADGYISRLERDVSGYTTIFAVLTRTKDIVRGFVKPVKQAAEQKNADDAAKTAADATKSKNAGH